MDRNVDRKPAPKKFNISEERASEKIKGYAKFLEADLVHIGRLDPEFIYSNIAKDMG